MRSRRSARPSRRSSSASSAYLAHPARECELPAVAARLCSPDRSVRTWPAGPRWPSTRPLTSPTSRPRLPRAGRCRPPGTPTRRSTSSSSERIFARAWQYVGPRRGRRRAGLVPRRAGRAHAGRRRPRQRTASCAGSSTSAATAPTSSPTGEGCRATLAVPLPRLDVRPRRDAPAAPLDRSVIPDFDPDAFSLLPVSVDTWGPLVFATPTRTPRPLAETRSAGVAEIVAASGVGFDSLRFRHRVTLGAAGQLEERARELPRVLPLRGRAPRSLEDGQRRRGRVLADRAAAVLEPGG